MSWFKNLRTAIKFAITFGLCIFLILVLGETSLVSMGRMNRVADSLGNESFRGLSISSDLSEAYNALRLREYKLALNFEKDQSSTLKDIQKYRKQSEKLMADYEKIAKDPIEVGPFNY